MSKVLGSAGDHGPAARVDAVGSVQVLPSGVGTDVAFTGALYASVGMWNILTPTLLTCIRTGLYLFGGEIESNINTWAIVRLVRSGGITVGKQAWSNAVPFTGQAWAVYPWVLGETIALNVQPVANLAVQGQSFLSANWLRPLV